MQPKLTISLTCLLLVLLVIMVQAEARPTRKVNFITQGTFVTDVDLLPKAHARFIRSTSDESTNFNFDKDLDLMLIQQDKSDKLASANQAEEVLKLMGDSIYQNIKDELVTGDGQLGDGWGLNPLAHSRSDLDDDTSIDDDDMHYETLNLKISSTSLDDFEDEEPVEKFSTGKIDNDTAPETYLKSELEDSPSTRTGFSDTVRQLIDDSITGALQPLKNLKENNADILNHVHDKLEQKRLQAKEAIKSLNESKKMLKMAAIGYGTNTYGYNSIDTSSIDSNNNSNNKSTTPEEDAEDAAIFGDSIKSTITQINDIRKQIKEDVAFFDMEDDNLMILNFDNLIGNFNNKNKNIFDRFQTEENPGEWQQGSTIDL